MKGRFTWYLAMILAACIGPGAAAAPGRCELHLLGDVEAQVSPTGALLLAGSLNGHEVWFELRTSDGIALIREAAVSEVGLATSTLQSNASGGSRITTSPFHSNSSGKNIERFAKMTGMQLGPIKVPGFEALVVPAPGDELPHFRDRPIVGTVGGSLLTLSDAEISLAEHRVRFFRQSECKDDPVYWDGEFAILPLHFDYLGSLLFAMELDGQKVDTSLVGGTRESRLDEGVTRKFFGFDSTSPGIEKQSVAAGKEQASFKAMSLTAEGLNVRNTRIQLRTASHCTLTAHSDQGHAIGYDNCNNIVPFTLGTDLIRQLRIYIASKKGKIYISKVVAAAPSP
jgi:hypothetical protein